MSQLFSTLTIGAVTLKNRIAVSPMCQYSSVDGFANDWHLVHLGSRAVGGAGLVIMEASAVSPEGRITPEDNGIWSDAHIPKLQQITDFIAQQGVVAGIQLAHAGRKASHYSPWKGGQQLEISSGGWSALAPSAIPFKEGSEAPQALDHTGIQKVIEDFRNAAKRSVAAGFKLIELHGAHGYLLHEFLSPLCNHRLDDYGGSFENRIRLLLEVTSAVKAVLPGGYPLFVRISATDWAEGGWMIEDSVQLATRLKDLGVDLIDCSSGGAVHHQRIILSPGYQAHFAEQIRKEAGILTGAVGLITTAAQSEAIIVSGQADLVLLAREELRDPYFPIHAAHELHADHHWPVQYERAKRK